MRMTQKKGWHLFVTRRDFADNRALNGLAGNEMQVLEVEMTLRHISIAENAWTRAPTRKVGGYTWVRACPLSECRPRVQQHAETSRWING